MGTETAVLDRQQLEEFSHRWLACWNAYDGDGLAALCTEDVEFFDPAIGTVHGRPAVADWVGICKRAFPDYRFEESEPPYVSPDRPKAIAPWQMFGTNTGPLDPPGFAPTGRPLVLGGVDHWWFRRRPRRALPRGLRPARRPAPARDHAGDRVAPGTRDGAAAATGRAPP